MILGALGVLVILVVGVVVVGSWRWRSITDDLRQRLDEARADSPTPHVDLAITSTCPEPVQRYLSKVLKPGSRFPHAMRMSHSGTMNLSEEGEKWSPFSSDQYVVLRRPGFDWNARVPFAPGLAVRVHDAYVQGTGYLEASLVGLIKVAYQRDTGGELAKGELMRFLAESPWYPHVLLPGHGVEWDASDAHSARATLEDGDIVVQLTFHFNDDALISVIEAEARGRTVGADTVPTPWKGQFSNYAERGGTLVPLDAEVAWVLPRGPLTYWRGHVETLEYDYASLD